MLPKTYYHFFSGTSKLLSNGCCGCQERKTIESCSLTNEIQRKKATSTLKGEKGSMGNNDKGEKTRRKRKKRILRICVDIFNCDCTVFPPSTTCRVIFNSPPCLVPKWKRPTRQTEALLSEGFHGRVAPLVHEVSVLTKLFNVDVVRREMPSSVYLVLF